jgi:crossover junction endodeoxyribonuclease RusA
MKDEESVIITLPLPSPYLSSNRPASSRGGRMRRYRLTKKYREIASTVATEAGIETGPWDRATVQSVFFHKTKRRRDDVNFLSMLKPAYDGIVDSGLLVDDDAEHLKTLPASFEIDKICPRVEMTIRRVTDRDESERVDLLMDQKGSHNRVDW